MIAYIDTNVAVWLSQGKLSRLSPSAKRILDTADLLISPMVVIELEYLSEVHRTKLPSGDVLLKIEREMGVQVCTISFATIARIAVGESWTRDPFDRIIVANAKANGLAYLISADEHMAKHYARAVW